MGYYVEYNIEATFKPESEPEMLKAINALHEPETLKAHASGGSWSGGERKEVWYSWVDNPPPGGFTTIEDAMYAWRFDVDQWDGLKHFSFTGEKLGQEEILFEALAPFLDGEIFARGEDGEEWGFRFKDGRMIQLECIKNWEGA